MKFRNKITLTIVTSGITLSLVLISIFTIWSRYEISNKVIESFRVKNVSISSQIDSYIKNRISELYIINKSITYVFQKNDIGSLKIRLHEKRNELKSFENFQIYNLRGQKLIDTNQISINEKTIFEKEIFKSSPHDTNLSYRFEHSSKEELISLTQYILNEKDEPIGILIGNIPQKSLTKLIYANFTDGENQKVDLLREDGQILFSNYNFDIYAIDTLNEVKNKLQKAKDNFYFEEDSKVFKAFAKSGFQISSELNSWYILISVDKHSIYSPIYRRALYFGIITFLIISVFTIFSYRIARNLTKNIEVATDAINELAKGNFNKLENITVENDDIGVILINLQQMSKKINYLIEDQKKKTQIIAVGKMAGSIAHEINNPIHLMSNQIKQIEKILERNNIVISNEIDRNKLKRNFTNIYQTTTRIKKIILKLKDLTNENTIEPTYEVNINLLLTEFFKLKQSIYHSNNIDFNFSLEEFDFNIKGRGPQILQVLENVINNAYDAIKTLDTRWINIKCHVKEEQYQIEISNSGEIIDPVKAEQIFSPTYSMKENVMRVGMNLAISKSILDSFGGNIYVDLNAKNTTFVITLPIAKNIPTTTEQDSAA